MNWQAMSKEQKQKAVLAGLLGLFFLAALYQFALVPLMNRQGDLEQRRNELKTTVEKARGALRSEAQLEQQTSELHAALDKVFSGQIPPSDSALSWASQAIYAQTRQMGLEVISIAEGDSGMSSAWNQTDAAKRSFRPYSVRLELACSFENIRKLVRSLQQSNPYLAVIGITVAAESRNVEKPAVSLMLEWPAWRDPKQGEKPFESKAGAGAKKGQAGSA